MQLKYSDRKRDLSGKDDRILHTEWGRCWQLKINDVFNFKFDESQIVLSVLGKFESDLCESTQVKSFLIILLNNPGKECNITNLMDSILYSASSNNLNETWISIRWVPLQVKVFYSLSMHSATHNNELIRTTPT